MSSVSNQRVHLQKDGGTYSYGIICSDSTSMQPRKQIISYNRLPEDEPSGSKHVEDIAKIKTLV